MIKISLGISKNKFYINDKYVFHTVLWAVHFSNTNYNLHIMKNCETQTQIIYKQISNKNHQ